MKDIITVINENEASKMELAQKRLEEKVKKNQEKIDKQTALLNKKIATFDKICEKYKADKEVCDLIPFEIFNNFKWISHTQEKALADQLGVRTLLFPYNPACGDMYYKKSAEIRLKHGITPDTKYQGNEQKFKDADEDEENIALHRFYWEYFTKANDLIETIHDKEKLIKELQDNVIQVSIDVQTAKERAQRITDLYEQVPELAEFIDKVAEQQYEFYVKQNEKLKVDWEKYKAEIKKLDEKYGSQWSARCNRFKDNSEGYNKYMEADKLKPKQIVRTEAQIRKWTNDWKESERALLADRITTEFGKVKSTELHIGADGNVNGMIYGTLKSAKIETIYAGGYNIQCLHTRLLVHEK